MIPFPDKKYKTIVIDPPWPSQVISDSASKKMRSPGLSKGMPYKTMTLKEIKALPIPAIAEKDCNLFIWTTQQFFEAAYNLAKKWGFTPAKVLTWNKVSGINWLGFYSNAEFVIFAYRGKYTIDVKSHKYMATAFTESRSNHSKKPDKFYSMLLESTPGPRIDIFARQARYGFDIWGDEAPTESDITIDQFLEKKKK